MPTSTVAELLNISPVTYRYSLPSDTFVLPGCLIGVEMELEGDVDRDMRNDRTALREAAANFVSVKEDGSLRNGGVELVFDGPQRGTSAITALDHMFRIKENYGLLGSFRTSTHVHVNYADIDDTADVLGRSVAIFLLIEKAAAATCGEAREYNTFCVPSYMMRPQDEETLLAVAGMDGGTSAERADFLMRRISSLHRYAAMNLAALYRFGTIEYRLLGTASRDVTYNWVNLLLEIKKAASTMTRSDILAHSSFLAFIRHVLPRCGDYLVYNDEVEAHYRARRSCLIRETLSEQSVPDEAPYVPNLIPTEDPVTEALRGLRISTLPYLDGRTVEQALAASALDHPVELTGTTVVSDADLADILQTTRSVPYRYGPTINFEQSEGN